MLGYAPLLVRLVQSLAMNNNSWTNNWNVPQPGGNHPLPFFPSVQDSLRLLPGPLHEFTQNLTKAEEFADALTR